MDVKKLTFNLASVISIVSCTAIVIYKLSNIEHHVKSHGDSLKVICKDNKMFFEKGVAMESEVKFIKQTLQYHEKMIFKLDKRGALNFRQFYGDMTNRLLTYKGG